MWMVSTMCPMDSTWRKWALFSDVNGRLDAESQARVTYARQARRMHALGILDVNWETAADDESVMPVDEAIEERFDLGTASHTHGNVVVAGRPVHMDVVAARRSDPTFAFRDFRIHVAGVLCGRALQQQCGLGGIVSDLPAVALVGGHAVILSIDMGALLVELWETSYSGEGMGDDWGLHHG